MIFYSSIEPIYFLLPFVGLLVGLFGAILGGGGGFIFLPLLTLVLEVPMQTAVITSLVATLPICIVGSWGHYQNGNINFKIGALFALVGIIGALLGTWITSSISANQLKTGFGIYSVLIALNMGYATWQNTRHKANGNRMLKATSRWMKISRGSIYGFSAGTITGVFGTSGTAPILAGLFYMNIPLKMVIGTSLLVVMVNTLFSVGAHFFVSKIDITLVLFLTAGSIIGTLAGTRFHTKTNIDNSENTIKYAYAAGMVLLGIMMIIK
ncbi:MAG: sulfite exporter TauE/SafE family protein [Bacteroidetes bacterium]|nr:MAG: sulfite exporter TauE/SafE family protein [Bacteroidota bacterium]